MTDLSDRLERIGLSQYLESFVSEGFDSWETVLDITESDLNYLNVKLGHRRKLQRAIAESRGQPADRALVTEHGKISGVDGSYRSDDSGAEPRDASAKAVANAAASSGPPGPGTKRKYRRHPKPDPSAPERPPSAYVIFSNQVREELKGQDLSFTEIAKIVGERWQVLFADIRDGFESQANSAKEKYYSELAEYKKTPEYAQYQEYLTDFKAKHGNTRVDGKRSRLETETSTTSVDAHPVRSNHPGMEGYYGGTRSSGSSPPSATLAHVQSGFQRPSASASPAVHSETLNSPARADQYSPETGSAVSSVTSRSKELLNSRSNPGEPRLQNPPLLHHHSSSSQSASYSPQSTYRQDHWNETPPQSGWPLPRRESRGSPPPLPPPLTHQESTLSSESVAGGPLPPPSSLLPVLDPSKPSRTLPQPVATMGARTTSLEPRGLTGIAPPLPPLTGPGPPDSTRSSNWPALLRATELAREAQMRGSDGKDVPRDHPPPPPNG